MKNTFLLLVLVAVISGCATADRADSSSQSVEQQVAALDDEAMTAYYLGDTSTLRRLEANDLVVIGDEGKAWSTAGRYASIDRQVKEGRWFPGGAGRTNETRAIRIFGPTAIVHGIAVVKTRDSQERVAFSEVWNQRNGTWRFVHLHFHTLKGPPPVADQNHAPRNATASDLGLRLLDELTEADAPTGAFVSLQERLHASGVRRDAGIFTIRPRICICSSEPMGEDSHAHSRNPNVCAICFNLLDETQGSNTPHNSVVSRKEDVHATGVTIYATIRH
jgi:hypothetical protein